MRLSKRGELKALRAGLKRLQLENLQHIKKKKHLGPVQPPNFSWAEPNTLNYSYTKSSAFSPSPAGNFASGATLERLWFRRILGDPGAVSRVGRKGATKAFNYGRKSPWVPTLTEIFPRIQADAAPDWAQKILCIIVPNRRTVSSEFLSWVRTRRLLFQSRLVWLMHQRNAGSQETFSLI